MVHEEAPEVESGEGVTHRLCSWVNGLTLEEIPENIKTRAKYLMLDGFGCAIVGAHLPWTEKAVNIVLDMEAAGDCLVWGYDKKLGPLSAALLNSTEVQSFELDDWHSLAPVHSNSIMLPALLAAASQQKARANAVITGSNLLLSTIIGYEVGPRVGLCLHGSHMLTRGWHSGPVFGHAACATSVGKLLSLSTDEIEDAVGIACTQACGLMSAQFGSEAKRMQHGFAARNGVFAALLAKGGYSGIKRVFEEKYGGFLSVFGESSGRHPPYLQNELIKGLGEIWQTESIRVKPHASMAGTHCTIDTIAGLKNEYPEKLKDLSGVKDITIEMSEAAFKHGGWTAMRPLTATGAQMSCAYVAAVQLLDGQVLPQQFHRDLINRDSIWRLIENTRCQYTPELGQNFEQRVTIAFNDGSSISKTMNAPRGVEPPLTNNEILAKFRTFTRGLIDNKRQDIIEKLVLGLEDITDVSCLDEVLAGSTLDPLA